MKFLCLLPLCFACTQDLSSQISVGLTSSHGATLTKYRNINLTPFEVVPGYYQGHRLDLTYWRNQLGLSLGLELEKYDVSFQNRNDPSFKHENEIPKVQFSIPTISIPAGIAVHIFDKKQFYSELYTAIKFITSIGGFNSYTPEASSVEFIKEGIHHRQEYSIYNNSNRDVAFPVETKIGLGYRSDRFSILLNTGYQHCFKDVTSYIYSFKYYMQYDPSQITKGDAFVSFDASVLKMEIAVRYHFNKRRA